MSACQAIVGGCACFWGSILGMGMTYMLVVLLKRSFEPQEITKEEEWTNIVSIMNLFENKNETYNTLTHTHALLFWGINISANEAI